MTVNGAHLSESYLLFKTRAGLVNAAL